MIQQRIEIWKPIQEFDNYEVSNYGRIRSNDYNHTGKSKILKIFRNAGGYIACNLMQNGARKRMLVHRLVAIQFISTSDYSLTVNHIDFDKTNNCAWNLEWMSISENLKDSHAKGHVKYSFGENHYHSKMNTEDILEIKRLLLNGIKGRSIANQFGVGEKYISSIIGAPQVGHFTIGG